MQTAERYEQTKATGRKEELSLALLAGSVPVDRHNVLYVSAFAAIIQRVMFVRSSGIPIVRLLFTNQMKASAKHRSLWDWLQRIFSWPAYGNVTFARLGSDSWSKTPWRSAVFGICS